MGGGADQDRHLTDNHLYADLLDNGPGDAFDKDESYGARDVDEGQENTLDNDNDYEQNINIIDHTVFVKIPL